MKPFFQHLVIVGVIADDKLFDLYGDLPQIELIALCRFALEFFVLNRILSHLPTLGVKCLAKLKN